MTKKRTQIAVLVDDKMLSKIEDYRFGNRFPTRSAALMSLVEKGLKVSEEDANQKND